MQFPLFFICRVRSTALALIVVMLVSMFQPFVAANITYAGETVKTPVFTHSVEPPESPAFTFAAEAIDSSVTLSSNITEWTMDEAKGRIYALSKSSNKLLFIRMSDLVVEKEIGIGSQPSDLELDQENGKLYVALSGAMQIKIIDTTSQQIVETLTTNFLPRQVTVDGEKIYYTSDSYFMYVIDAASKSESTFTMLPSMPNDIAVDRSKDILYAGGSYLLGISTITREPWRSMQSFGGYSYAAPLYVDGNDVFFAGQKFDADRPAIIHGKFMFKIDPSLSVIMLDVTDKYVINKHPYNYSVSVFNRETFEPVFSLPAATTLALMDANSYIYTYQDSNQKLIKSKPDLTEPPADTFAAANNKLKLEYGLLDWVADNQYIYGVSRSNKLYYIRKSDLAVEKEVFIGSNPLDVSLYKGKLYVALENATKLAVVDLAVPVPSVSYILLDYPATHIEPTEERIFFRINNGAHEARVLETVYGATYGVSIDLSVKVPTNYGPSIQSHYYPRFLADEDNGFLYIYDSSYLYKLNLDTLAYIERVYASDAEISNTLIRDGDYLFTNKRQISASVMDQVYATYQEKIITVSDEYVFTHRAIYSKSSSEKLLDLPYEISLASVDADGTIYLYVGDTNMNNPAASMKRVHKYTDFEQLKIDSPANWPPQISPSWGNFYDSDTAKGKISGDLNFTLSAYSHLHRYIESFSIYFGDVAGNKLGGMLGEVVNNGGATFTYKIPAATVPPQDAVNILIFSKNIHGESEIPAIVGLNDRVVPQPPAVIETDSFRMFDLIERKGEILLRLSFTVSSAGEAKYFQLSWIDQYGRSVGNWFAQISVKEGRNIVTFQEPMNIPDTAEFVRVSQVLNNGEIHSTPIMAQIYDNVLGEATAPLSSELEVLNGWGKIYFYDENLQREKIGGRLWWTPFEGINVDYYEVYFLNAEGQRLKPIAELRGFQSYHVLPPVMHLPDTVIPEGAALIGVYAVDLYGEIVKAYSISLWDSPDNFAARLTFTDLDPLAGEINGRLSWKPSADESLIAKYVVYAETETVFSSLTGMKEVGIDGKVSLESEVKRSAYDGKVFPQVSDRYISWSTEPLPTPTSGSGGSGIPSGIYPDSLGIRVAEVDKGQNTYSLDLGGDKLPLTTTALIVVAVNSRGEAAQQVARVNTSDDVSGSSITSLPVRNIGKAPYVLHSKDWNGDVGVIQGQIVLVWETGSSANGAYLYALNDRNEKIKALSWIKRSAYIAFHILPDDFRLPPGATKLGLVLSNGISVEAPIVLDELVDLTYHTSPQASNVSITKRLYPQEDTIELNGLVKGTIVRVYRSATVPYDMVNGTADTTGKVSVSLSQLGAAAGSVYVTLESSGTTESHRIEVPYDSEFSKAPTANQITVTNNRSGTNDTIAVSGLLSGDVVKVYTSVTAAESIGTATVSAQNTSVVISLSQLGTGAGSVYITVTSGTKPESPRTVKSYLAETTGGGGGGFGGGGGTGGVSNPVGGTGVAATPAPSKTNRTDSKPVVLLVETSTNQEGQKVLSALVDLKALDRITDSGRLHLQVDGDGDVVQIVMDAATFAELTHKHSGAVIVIQSGVAGFEIPANLLQQSAQALGIDLKGANISIHMSRADQATGQRMTDAVNQAGAKQLIEPIEFKIEITTGDTVVELNQFSGYVGRTVSMPEQTATGGMLTGVMLISETGEMIPVPTIVTYENGKMIVTLLRKGNSVYTIVRRDVSFPDLPETHYAKRDVETLAAKLVISGYEDGSFQPSGKVTRAEFATMLSRALGIAPEPSSTSVQLFSDVQENDWFTFSVNTAAAAGLLSGYEDGTFQPNRKITREEMTVMINNAFRYAGAQTEWNEESRSSQLSRFSDADTVSTWAADALAKAVSEGIVNGYDETTFQPKLEADRAQSATMLFRLLNALKLM